MENELYKKNCSTNQYNPKYITKLLDNSRSHSKIIGLSNKLFYENELRYCGDETSLINDNLPKTKTKDHPVIFYAIQGEEQQIKGSFRYNNFIIKFSFERKLQ